MEPTMEDKFTGDINRNIGIIHKVCNVYFDNLEDRQDAKQEILYQLWKSYSSYNGDALFSTWMYKVALNTAITYVKKNRRHFEKNMLTANPEEEAANANAEQNQDPERLSLLYTAINSLSSIDKAITLLYLEDNSYETIAAITGLTKSNVSVRLVRIKKSLKEKLNNI